MPTVVVALVATGVLVLAACGSDSKTSKGSSSAAAPVSLSGTVTNKGSKDVTTVGTTAELGLEVDDLYFKPTFVKVAAGATIQVELENEGKSQHTFTIDGLGIDKVLDPDQKTTVEVKMPQQGAVRYYCRFHHRSGMQGALYVTGGAKPETTTSASGSGY